MNCSDAKNHCQRYLDKELDSVVCQEIASHLSTCHCCAELYESQGTFHRIVKTVLCQSAQAQIRPALKQSILDRLYSHQDPDKIVHMFSPRYRPMAPNSSVATAAACMLLLTGIVGFQSTCVQKPCSMVVAAQYEHDNIVLGNRRMVAASNDPVALTKAIKTQIGTPLGIPNLSQCEVEPAQCGVVNIPGLPQGVYVKYVHCQCNNQPVTIMIIDTPMSPSVPKVEDFFLARQSGHNVVSWRNTDDGPLFMLVSKIPLQETLIVARLARK